MRTQHVKRIRNQPMKSPSPDIANRNIIKDTKIPIDQIHRYLQKSSGSKSMKSSSRTPIKNSGFNSGQIQSLKKIINDLQRRNQELECQNKNLKQRLNSSSNSYPQPQKQSFNNINQVVRSEYTSRDLSPKSFLGADQRAQKLQERLMKFVSQNTRLGNLLYEKQNMNQILHEENQILGRQINMLKNNTKNNSVITNSEKPYESNQVQEFYYSRFEPKMRQSQIIWSNRIKQLNDKINQLRDAQNQIERQLSKKSSEVSPTKNRRDQRTANTYRRSTASPEYVRPFGESQQGNKNKQMQGKIKKLQEQLQFFKAKSSNLSHQLAEERSKIKGNKSQSFVQDTSRQKNRSKINRSQISGRQRSINSQNQNMLKEKIQQLEFLLQKKMNEIADYNSEIQILKIENNRLKQCNERSKNILQKQKSALKNNYEQEKSIISNQNIQLSDKIIQLEDQYNSLEQELLNQINKNKEQQQLHNIKISQLIKDYEQKLKNQEKSNEEYLQKYLQLLKQIKKDIENSDNDDILTKNQGEDYQITKESVQQRIFQIQQQNLASIKKLKIELVEKEQIILELQKQLKIMDVQISQLKMQKQKLKEMMLKTQSFNTEVNKDFYENKTKLQQMIKQGQNCKLKRCLKETLRKIDAVENQISQLLRD